MNRLSKFFTFVSFLSLVVLLLMLPLAWVLRDGLGPSALDSKAFTAVVKMLSVPCVREVCIVFLMSRLFLLIIAVVRQMVNRKDGSTREERKKDSR